jgi:protein-S-isoprenylcysteine O-methyltransferase Ste14
MSKAAAVAQAPPKALYRLPNPSRQPSRGGLSCPSRVADAIWAIGNWTELEDKIDTDLEGAPAPDRMAGGADRHVRRLKRLMDLGERLFSVTLFALMVSGFLKAGLTVGSAPALLSEGLVAALMVARRPTQDMSMRPWEWLIGLAGVAAPMLARPAHAPPLASPILCGAAIICGMLLSVWGKTILWRGFGLVAANRGVVQGGPYKVVRHPIYSGYVVTYVAFFLANPSPWNAAVELSATVLIVVRILAEERVLSADPAYQSFKSRVRYRLIPGVF